jgi:sucrose phosphorylase
MFMSNGTMLNTYPDSIGGTLSEIVELLKRPDMKGAFQSFYILPSVFNTDLDRGFSVISYDLNKLLAKPDDIEQLNKLGLDLKLDFVLNHISVLSPQFQDILKHGEKSKYRHFFVDWNQFWNGKGEMNEEGFIEPDETYLQNMFFRKPGLPLLMVRFPDGQSVPYWNTFYQKVSYHIPDLQEIMHTFDLQYCQAKALEEVITKALTQGKKLVEIDLSDILSDAQSLEFISWLESKKTYLGQMDVNIQSDMVWQYYDEVLSILTKYGASIVRLDAFGYASKIPGRKNFMNEPETWDILERIRVMAEKYGLTLLPEIHTAYEEERHIELSEKGYLVYDFFLPGLVIDAIEHHDGSYLARWAKEQMDRDIRSINMLGCHDGIPLLDLKGLVPEKRIQHLIDIILSRGGMIKNLHGRKDIYYQINATYFSALGTDERKLLLARAIQLFMPGKPQIWYLDLFAGENDVEAVGIGDDASHKKINRTNLSKKEIEHRLTLPVVRKQLELLKMRNQCEAFGFDAKLQISQAAPHLLQLSWSQNGKKAALNADLNNYSFKITADLDDKTYNYKQY